MRKIVNLSLLIKIKAIDYIENKSSSGHDVLLKYVKLEISKPFNQMITTGIFPDSLKIAKNYFNLQEMRTNRFVKL